MKLYDYDFREYERKFVIVSKTGNLLKELKKKPFITEDNERIDLNDLKEPFYGYIFIDNEEGITLRILGNDKTQRKYAKDVELLIRYNAFRDADFEYIIPEEVFEIAAGTFRSYSNLTSITIPNSDTSIGAFAFSGCSSLAEFKGVNASQDGRCYIINGEICAVGGAVRFII